MPFKSEAERRFLWAKHPEIAQRWSDKYGSGKGLPMHVKTKTRRDAVLSRMKRHEY